MNATNHSFDLLHNVQVPFSYNPRERSSLRRVHNILNEIPTANITPAHTTDLNNFIRRRHYNYSEL